MTQRYINFFWNAKNDFFGKKMNEYFWNLGIFGKFGNNKKKFCIE